MTIIINYKNKSHRTSVCASYVWNEEFLKFFSVLSTRCPADRDFNNVMFFESENVTFIKVFVIIQSTVGVICLSPEGVAFDLNNFEIRSTFEDDLSILNL